MTCAQHLGPAHRTRLPPPDLRHCHWSMPQTVQSKIMCCSCLEPGAVVSCTALKFGRGNKSITGMTSTEGESFSFRSVVPVEGAVESWMTAVEAEMRRTLAAVMKEGKSLATGCRLSAEVRQ